MATLSEIRDRLAVVLARVEGKDGGPLKVVIRPAESPPSARPVVVVGEPTAEFAEGDSRRGLDRWEFGLAVMVDSADYQLGSEALDAYLVRTGPKSIRQVIDADPSLGLQDGTRAWVDGMSDYGPRDPGGGVAAVLRLVVRTAG